jgi:hypothetical protein
MPVPSPAPTAAAVLLATLLLAGPRPAGAAAPPAPGARVRVTVLAHGSLFLDPAITPHSSLWDDPGLPLPQGVRPGSRIVGTLVGLDARAIVLRRVEGGPELRLARPAIAGLEVSAGRRSRAGRGALYGLLGGAAGGLGVGVYLAKTEDFGENQDLFERALPITLCIGGAAVGLGVGALVGSFLRHDDWQAAPMPAADE